MREPGKYWIKKVKGGVWTVGHYAGGIKCWWLLANEHEFYDKDLYKIYEERILNPDEEQ
jgi:hypothetical protein